MSLPTIPGIEPVFLERCLDVLSTAKHTSTFVSPTAARVKKPEADDDDDDDDDDDEVDADAVRARYTERYPEAYTDTYGTPSQGPLLYKTGDPWPHRTGGPHAHSHLREIRPVAHTHPIVEKWEGILGDISAYLDHSGIKFTVVTGLGFANATANTKIGSEREAPFCPLLVMIGVLPTTIEFAEAKVAANHVKTTILGATEFGYLDVAIREWMTSQSGGVRLPPLDPAVNGRTAKFLHPFASTLGVAVGLLKQPSLEGTLGVYLSGSQGSGEIIAITCCHVACPNDAANGITLNAGKHHRQEIVALGTRAYEEAVRAIMAEIGNLIVAKTSLNKKIKMLQGRVDNGEGGAVALAQQDAQQDEQRTTRIICNLNDLHGRVTKHLTFPGDRLLGRVLYADPIGPSSNKPDAYTVDWAAVALYKDAFADGFEGNNVYIGTSPLPYFAP